MAQVQIKLANGVSIGVDAKNVPALLAVLGASGNAKPVKAYIHEDDLAKINAKTPEEFVLKALDLQDGIHATYSGLNKLIRSRFGKDPIAVTTAMAHRVNKDIVNPNGVIDINSTKGGVRLTKAVKVSK